MGFPAIYKVSLRPSFVFSSKCFLCNYVTMKAVTILLLTTAATFLLASNTHAQENSLIADTIAQYISATTGGSSSTPPGQYPDAEADEPQEPDGLLTSFLTGPVINNFVRTVFNAVELKLNFLLTLRRILSYENIRACLLHLRKFLNLVLRLCTLINRFLPEAELDTSGLSMLMGYYPEKIPEKPASEYGAPAKPASEYGAPAKPASEYGVPTKPSSEYGAPAKPASEYGAPAKPASEYGAPAKLASEYGAPVKPASEYGIPAKSSPQYQIPAQTNRPFDFRVSTEFPIEDDDDDDDANDVFTPEKAKEVWNELKPTPEYDVPANEYGVPQDVYGVPSVQYANGYYYRY